MSNCNIVVVCGDPGGGNAVAPVVEVLQAQGRLNAHALAYRQAHTLWTDRGLPHEIISDDTTPKDIRVQLRRLDARLVLTGTSVNPLEFEKLYITCARDLSIPSLSVLDFWTNYRLRFSNPNGELAFLPDRIAVMDDLARAEMIAAGFPSGCLVVTGQPALDSLEAHRAAFTSARRDTLRQQFDVTGADWLLLYASQPPNFTDNDESIPAPWLDRQRTVGALLSALAELARAYGKSATLLVRPHPRENGEIYRSLTNDKVRIIVSNKGDSRDLALAADVVAGMNTMFLVEAAYLGRPTLSIRLGLPPPDDFPPNRSQLTRPIYQEEELQLALESMLTEGFNTFRSAPHQGNASGNVAKLAYFMLGI